MSLSDATTLSWSGHAALVVPCVSVCGGSSVQPCWGLAVQLQFDPAATYQWCAAADAGLGWMDTL